METSIIGGKDASSITKHHKNVAYCQHVLYIERVDSMLSVSRIVVQLSAVRCRFDYSVYNAAMGLIGAS